MAVVLPSERGLVPDKPFNKLYRLLFHKSDFSFCRYRRLRSAHLAFCRVFLSASESLLNFSGEVFGEIGQLA